jgi:hypothetical protein
VRYEGCPQISKFGKRRMAGIPITTAVGRKVREAYENMSTTVLNILHSEISTAPTAE